MAVAIAEEFVMLAVEPGVELVRSALTSTCCTQFEGSVHESEIIQKGTPPIRRLNMNKEFNDKKHQIRRLSHGPGENAQKATKTILLVGPTGSGKSTVLNALVNCVLGVHYTDNYRFWITVDENPGERQKAASKTRYVTCYELHHQSCFPPGFEFNLRIIDTPGFGDTDGMERDKIISEQLEIFFKGKGREGLDRLHAIGLVVKGPDNRLSEEHTYIFNSIMNVFGKDMAPAILVMATHHEGDSDEEPNVLAELTKAEVPYEKYFVFTNHALFSTVRQCNASEENAVGSDKASNVETECKFERNRKRYKKFLFEVATREPCSLVMTQDQQRERQRLEIRVENLKEVFSGAMLQAENLHKEIDLFLTQKAVIETNSEFEYKKPVVVYIREKVDEMGATNCTSCNVTCHYPCRDFGDWFVDWCYAFKGEQGRCIACPKRCPANDHKYEKDRIIPKTEERTFTAKTIKDKYVAAVGKKLSVAETILEMIKDIESKEGEIIRILDDMRECFDVIQKLAMRPDPLTAEGHIDNLIAREEREGRKNSNIRVQQLNAIKEMNALKSKVREGDTREFRSLSEPFQEIRREIESEIANAGT